MFRTFLCAQNQLKSQTLCSFSASSQTAVPLKWMVKPEPNSMKEKAISKFPFYYPAMCPAPLNLLHFVSASPIIADLRSQCCPVRSL